MAACLIDGKELAAQIRQELKQSVLEFRQSFNKSIGLAVILVGDDPASSVYVKNKISACEEIGIKSYAYHFDKDIAQEALVNLIETLNNDIKVNGILVQLPLPKVINSERILSLINYKKDVDGFHAMNAGNLMLSIPCLTACTPSGCIELIKKTGIDICGKHAVVIGRSNIVGKPVSMLLLQENATVTICHSKTVDIAKITRQADILVAAVGKPNFVSADMVKEGALVIDVGINRVDGKLCGDVDFDAVKEIAGYITPVPGGVGPMTIAMLMKNTYKAALLQQHRTMVKCD